MEMADGEPLPANNFSTRDSDTDGSSLSDFQAYELPQDVFAESFAGTPSPDGGFTTYEPFLETSSAVTPNENATDTGMGIAVDILGEDENATDTYGGVVGSSRGVVLRHSPHQSVPMHMTTAPTHNLTQTQPGVYSHKVSLAHTPTSNQQPRAPSLHNTRTHTLALSRSLVGLPSDEESHTHTDTHTPRKSLPLAYRATPPTVTQTSPTLSYTARSLSHNLSLTASHTSQGTDDSDLNLLSQTHHTNHRKYPQPYSHSHTQLTEAPQSTQTHSHNHRSVRARTQSQTNPHGPPLLAAPPRSPSATSLVVTIDERNRSVCNRNKGSFRGGAGGQGFAESDSARSRQTRTKDNTHTRKIRESQSSSASCTERQPSVARLHSQTLSLPDSLNSTSSGAHLNPQHYGRALDDTSTNTHTHSNYLHDQHSPEISECQLDRISSNGSMLNRRSDIGSAEELYRTKGTSIFSKTLRRKSSLRKIKNIKKALSWYEPDVKRAEVEGILDTAPPGTFVVRLARTGEDYCLSVRSDMEEMAVHILIERQSDGLQLGGDNVRFDNMQDLITYYKKHKITIEGQLSTTLKKPMCKYA